MTFNWRKGVKGTIGAILANPEPRWSLTTSVPHEYYTTHTLRYGYSKLCSYAAHDYNGCSSHHPLYSRMQLP